MRFPDTPFMKRVFDLFEKIGLKKEKIPYVMTLDSNLNYFNGKCLTNKEMEDKKSTLSGLELRASLIALLQWPPRSLSRLRKKSKTILRKVGRS